MPYRPELDGIRALCILFTMLNHIGPHPAWLDGSVGVDVFFALSGYLITTLLVRDVHAGHGVGVKSFYVRRFFRIVPLYYAVLLAYVVMAVTLDRLGIQAEPYREMSFAWPYLLSFTSELRSVAAGNIFGHAWTLGIEEKYYLAWPLLFIALQRASYRQRLVLLAIAFVLGAFVLRGDLFRGYGGLAIGSILAIALQQPDSRVSGAILSIPPIACVVGVALAYALTVITHHTAAHILIAATSGLLIANVIARPGLVGNVLSWSPLAAAGRHTYAIYLVHVLVANAVILALGRAHLQPGWGVVFCLTYAGSLAAAAVLKRTIEDPMIALGRRLQRRARPTPNLCLQLRTKP